MKKITIITSLTLSVFLISSSNNAQEKTLTTNLITDSINFESKNQIIDYRKASDSLLDIADKNNISAYENLERLKKLQYLKELQKKEINTERKKIKENLRKTLDFFKNKIIEDSIIKNNNEIILNNEIYKIDSVYQKGSLFKKSKWVYEITFPDGTKRKID